MKFFKVFFILVTTGSIATGLYAFSGLYPIGADVPHNSAVYWILEQVRETSIKRASADIEVPPLDDPSLLLSGASDYHYMCVTCHLKPGKIESDMSIGLYPSPPNLSLAHDEAHSLNENERAQKWFWTIKHGIKASGMPAWGSTHDDIRIWGMVAFLSRLPELTPAQYQILTANN